MCMCPMSSWAKVCNRAHDLFRKPPDNHNSMHPSQCDLLTDCNAMPFSAGTEGTCHTCCQAQDSCRVERGPSAQHCARCQHAKRSSSRCEMPRTLIHHQSLYKFCAIAIKVTGGDSPQKKDY